MNKRISAVKLIIIWFFIEVILMFMLNDNELYKHITFLLMGLLSLLRPTLVLDVTTEVSHWKMNREYMEKWYPDGYTPIFSEKSHYRFGIITGIVLIACGVTDLVFHWMSKAGF